VPSGAQLDIEQGAVIEAAPGVTIIIERGGRMNVQATLNEPVILTCRNGASTPGRWGGLRILGNAPLNHRTLTSPAGARGGTGGCREALLDGARCGGCTADDSSGVLRFTRIQYATHGLRIYGVGSKAVLQDIHAHRSLGRDAADRPSSTEASPSPRSPRARITPADAPAASWCSAGAVTCSPSSVSGFPRFARSLATSSSGCHNRAALFLVRRSGSALRDDGTDASLLRAAPVGRTNRFL